MQPYFTSRVRKPISSSAQQIYALKREVDQLWASLDSLNEKQIHAQQHQRQIDDKLAQIMEQTSETTTNGQQLITKISSAIERYEAFLRQNKYLSVSI